MTIQEYQSKRDDLIASFNNFTLESDERRIIQFNMASASLYNFMPDLAITKHPDIYKNILLHKKLSILEQQALCVLDYVTIEDSGMEVFKQLKEKPSIVCTFHTGSYRVINLLLAKHKIPFTLVIGKGIGEQEGDSFSSIFNNISGDCGSGSFRIIDAEGPGAGLQMLRELRQGRTLVLYIDGNSGAGVSTSENENSSLVKFMQQGLFARKGIAFLTHLANVPILTVASFRKSWNDIRLKFYEPIIPDGTSVREDFAIETTQRIYDLVSSIIKMYPEQWEGWLYVHKFTNIVNLTSYPHKVGRQILKGKKVRFNSQLFSIFKLYNIPFLLNRNTYSFYEVDNHLFEMLSRGNGCTINRRFFGSDLFNQLYEQGILVSA